MIDSAGRQNPASRPRPSADDAALPDLPDVSIVIAARNEEAHITSCLQSIFDAEPFAPRFEILVVDGDSSDGTAGLAGKFAASHPEVLLFINPHRFAPQGFNIGIKAARGNWIFILGAHSRYDPSYFRLCLETTRRTGAENVGGCVVVEVREEGLTGTLAKAVGSSRFGFGASPFRRQDPPEGPADTAAFGCFPRRTFETYGLYDERLVLNQDWELNQRIRRAGGTVWLNPAIRLQYFARQDPRVMMDRAYDTGLWVAYLWTLGPYTASARHAIPAVFTAAMLVPGVNIAALAAHQATALAAAVAQAVRFGDARLLPTLPPLFLGIHAAYGAGTLKGLWDIISGRSPVSLHATIEYLQPETHGAGQPASSPAAGKPQPRRRS